MTTTNFRNLRMSADDSQRIAMLKQQIANNLQTQFVAGGDNQALKSRCDELSAEIRSIESKYTTERAA
jgi:hypothetical protein